MFNQERYFQPRKYIKPLALTKNSIYKTLYILDFSLFSSKIALQKKLGVSQTYKKFPVQTPPPLVENKYESGRFILYFFGNIAFPCDIHETRQTIF